jgi:hypothetical protein
MNRKIKEQLSLIISTHLLSIVCFLVLGASGVLMLFSIEYSFYLYLFFLGCILGYYILKNTKFFQLWVILTASFFWSTSLLILLSGVLAMLSIPIMGWVLYIPILLSIPLFVFYPITIKDLRIRPETDGIILLLFTILSLISHVFSVRGFIVPILHDPISHATWAKQIYDTGMINYFYSPGLHILSALGMMVDGINVATYVLIITNIFNALTFIPAYLFIRSYFIDKKFALLSASIFLIALFPSKLFWAAGKNALIMGIGFMLFLFFVSTLNMSRIKKLLLINSLVFVLILVHYPTAFIALIGLFFLFLSQKASWKNLRNIILGCGFGVVWGVLKMKYQIANMEERIAGFPTRAFNLESILSFAKGIYKQVTGIYFSYSLGEFLVAFGLLGLGIMVVISIKRKKYLWFMLIPVANIVSMFLIEFTEKLSAIHIVYLTQILVFFVFIYIGAGFLLGKVVLPFILDKWKNFFPILLVILTILAVYSNYRIYRKYREKQSSLNMVQEPDLDLYRWMRENIDEESVILNNAQMGNRKDVVFASDGGAWIPVFTQLETAMPFTDFSSVNTHENYEFYTNVRDEDFTCEDIDNLLNKGIEYYYQGSKPVYGRQINIKKTGENFELLFSSGSAKIFKIISCD